MRRLGILTDRPGRRITSTPTTALITSITSNTMEEKSNHTNELKYLVKFAATISEDIEAQININITEWCDAYHVTINGRHRYASDDRHEIKAYLFGYRAAVRDIKNNPKI